MGFADLLRRRRIVREYRPEPVADDIVGRVVRVVRRPLHPRPGSRAD